MVETWLPVPGYEGFYEVSDHGRVRSIPRTVRASNRVLNYQGKVLKENIDTGGYAQVCLCNHTKRTTFGIHQLVALAFLGPKPEGQEVRHMDGVRLNNHRDNLEWGTRSDNTKDKFRHGTHNWLKSQGGFLPDTFYKEETND